jgi:hypothetical protein
MYYSSVHVHPYYSVLFKQSYVQMAEHTVDGVYVTTLLFVNDQRQIVKNHL